MNALYCLAALLAAVPGADAAEVALHGFLQAGYASRVTGERPSSASGDFLVGEERLQLALSGAVPSNPAAFSVKADFFHDGIARKAEMEVREAYLDLGEGPLSARLGRQIITWGTGDLLFINDVFPKDWTALFSGRPLEYLKLGSDALKVNALAADFDLEAVAIPYFEADRLPASDRFFVFDPLAQVTNRTVENPRADLSNAELALKVSRPLGRWDAALYAYRGFYRSPAMVPDSMTAPTRVFLRFPRRNVYGASIRGAGLGGVVSLEGGYYDSRKDHAGSDPLVPNSQALYLAGYQRQLGEDLNAGVQYYGEHMLHHDRYLAALPAGFPRNDRLRHLVAGRLTRFLKYQTWKLSLFGYYSPSDEDFYLIPEVWHSLADGVWLALGANVFGGARRTTFFGQFDRNDNVYLTARYEF